MSFRFFTLAAAAALTLGSVTPASAQPQPPIRPRYSSFGGIFGSSNPVAPGGLFGGNGLFGGYGFGNNFSGPGGVNPVIVNPLFAGGLNGVGPLAGGFLYPGQTAFPQILPGAIGVNPSLAPTGVVGTFNNYGHWYGPRSGYYGHWYPNGLYSGLGVLGNGATGGYGGVYAGGLGTAQMRPGSASMLGSTMLGAGLANQMNQLRR
jgi:hypothetical protein